MNATPDMMATTLKMVAALALVLAVLGVFFYISKRVMRKDAGTAGGKMIRVLASQYIGMKKNISLVQVPGAILVVGIAGDSIRLLTRIDDPEVLERFHDPQNEHTIPSFSDHLNKLTRRFLTSKSDP